MAEGRDGAIWIGTVKGLAFYKDGVVRNYTNDRDLAEDVIMALHVDAKGDLWVGTVTHGVKRISRTGIIAYGQEEGLPEEFVNCIAEDSDGTLWLGTNGGGLVRFRNGRFTIFTSKQGLLEDAIAQVLDDGHGSLWLSSYRGIFRIAKHQLEEVAAGKIEAVQSTAYGKSDGMKTLECTARNQPAGWRAANGSLWFPTAEGIALIDPNHLSRPVGPPPVVIELITADKKALKPAGRRIFESRYRAVGNSLRGPEFASTRKGDLQVQTGWIRSGMGGCRCPRRCLLHKAAARKLQISSSRACECGRME